MADDENSSGSEEEIGAQDLATSKKLAAFQMLMEDDDANSPAEASDSDDKEATPIKEKPKEPTAESKKKKQAKKKEKKGGKQKGGQEEEDLDALLAAIDAPKAKETAPSKKKGKKDKEVTSEEKLGEDNQDQTEPVPAAKPEEVKAEPGEEDSKKKKKKKKKDAKSKQEVNEDEPQNQEEGAPKTEEHVEGEEAEGDAGTEGKKKDKKKKKKGKEEETGKKKTKAHVSAIKDFLRKKQEEEEKRRIQEEEEEARLVALEKEKEEQLRLEQERKALAKQRKKEKEDQMKKEGTFLTDKEKKKRAQDQQRLEELRKQGLIVPALEGGAEKKKKVVYDDKLRKRKQRQHQQQQKEAQSTNEKEKSQTPEEEKEIVIVEEIDEKEKATPVEKEEEIADAWDEEDITDSWEKIDIEPKERKKKDEKAEDSGNINIQKVSHESQEGSSESGSSSEDESSEEEEEEEERGHETKEEIRARVVARIKKRREDAEAKRSKEKLRSPVICVLGHVDTGKTKILDKIRKTHVQDGEAGGITQQIGATQVPLSAIMSEGNRVKDLVFGEIKLPGFLIIDTPGHESFSNLRSRGSSLCDLAILVVDIMHGLEPQTLESIDLLLKRKTPFIIALNKVDRLYNWKQNAHKDLKNVLKSQEPNTQLEFKERYEFVLRQFAEKGLNIALFWENSDPKEYYSVIPTSAHSGDGMGNLMIYIAEFCQKHLPDRLAFSEELDCTVLEVKTEPGLGRCIDAVLVNGTLRVQDIIIVAGLEGPIVTQIRELLMPQPLRELRVKNPYEHFKEIRGAQGVRILAKDLEKALAGLSLLVAHREDEVDVLRQDVSEILERRLRSYKVSERGVYVQASTLGSLEALLAFLDSQKITYCGINIGPVHRKDVMKSSTMLEHDPTLAVILAFDVTVDRDAQQEADKVGVKIMTAPIIYHLQDKLLAYREELRLKKRQENAHLAIFPCKLRILPSMVFNKRDPIVMGVSVEAGQVKSGTPICVPSKENIFIGTISSIENNHKQVDIAKSGMEVCIKIENTTGDAPKMYDRHFSHEDILISRISRETIDVCKSYFREDLSKDDWRLIVELKKLLKIY